MTNETSEGQELAGNLALARSLLEHNNRVKLGAAAGEISNDRRSPSTEGGAFVVLAGAIFYNQLTVDIDFKNGDRIRYVGNIWGALPPIPGLAGVGVWFNYSKDELLALGGVDCEVAQVPGALQLHWWRGSSAVGNGVGIGLTGLGVGGGPGKFVTAV